MKRSRVIRLLPAFAALILVGLHGAHANLFSRMIKLGNQGSGEDRPAPSGAASAMGPDSQVGSIISVENGILLAHLANNNKIPLVGFGVGNLQHDLVTSMVAEAIQDDKKSWLIDTAHASFNEGLVAQGILDGVERMSYDSERRLKVHVLTKVWYTHLGYQRTKLSVEESLKALEPILTSEKLDVQIHILLHWPRCFDDIPWMNCEQEEEALPQFVKDAGPDPTKNPDTAWKESWRMLEDLYLSEEYPIASIGVSNFHLQDIEAMESFARIHPHVLQVNVWSLLYDPHLVDYCHKRRIHVQVYNAMQGTIVQPENAPRASNHLLKVANEISNQTKLTLTAAQVILAWLIQHGVSVIPRTSKMERLIENSAVALTSIPAFTDSQVETIAHAVEAYLSGDDFEQDIHVSVTFHAVSKDIVIYWLGDTDEIRIALVRRGNTFNETTYPDHVFRTYDALNKDIFVDHWIKANFGEHENIHVEL